jgi:hypothetical protein
MNPETQSRNTTRDHITNSWLDPVSRETSSPFSAASSTDDLHTGKTWATTIAKDPWQPLILTLDGGGIRGYSSLLLIQRLMREVAAWENFYERQQHPNKLDVTIFKEESILPCMYFDFMYGTSTGGLIGTMLGRLRMPVPICLEIYKAVGNELFGKRRSKLPLATKYHHQPLEAAVRDIVKKYCPLHQSDCGGTDWNPWFLELKELGISTTISAEDITTFDSGNETCSPYSEPFHPQTTHRICHSICLSAIHNQRISEAYLIRTYSHVYGIDTPIWVTRYNEGAEHLRIWEVTRATSAAPFFFKSLVVTFPDGSKREFKDGGIRENNPSHAAWSEFMSLYGEDAEPALLLSIGTGRPNMQRDGFATIWPGPFGKMPIVRKVVETIAVLKNMLVRYTEGETRHQDMLKLARGQHTWYKRLNVSAGLEGMRLDNWEASVVIDPETKERKVNPGGASLKRMEEATQKYLVRDIDANLAEYAPPREMLKQVAQKLVLTRRAREATAKENPERWESFSGFRLKTTKTEEDRKPSSTDVTQSEDDRCGGGDEDSVVPEVAAGT